MTPKDIWSRVTVLTVTHNGGEVIGNMLETVPSQVPLIVIDNASTDDTLDIVRAVAPQARLILNEVGLGYGNGMNCGLRNVNTEFALLVNPDSVLSEDAIIKLIQAADQFPEAGLFGPSILNPDGAVELSHDVNLFQRGALGKRIGEIHPEGPLSADFVTGAVMLLRMDAGRAVDFFDREIFLYYEDDDICMRLRKAGYGIVHVPDAVITHIGGGSVRPNRAYYWEKFWHISWSRFYFEKKHRGMNAARSLALKYACRYAFKALGYALVLKRSKAWRDTARFCGAIGFLLGKRASVLPAVIE
ncbi:glycosyltransferase family 2 protein [Kiloniella litopenaei]|uniref:glycosyltransferase family 2 protein n=1 Tax=Kiloniella litopenaei TaxID=1549748 RepID=UPI0006964E00|nr:glycosyltransferase family 2 protein [Kiloniella litopenaei]